MCTSSVRATEMSVNGVMERTGLSFSTVCKRKSILSTGSTSLIAIGGDGERFFASAFNASMASPNFKIGRSSVDSVLI